MDLKAVIYGEWTTISEVVDKERKLVISKQVKPMDILEKVCPSLIIDNAKRKQILDGLFGVLSDNTPVKSDTQLLDESKQIMAEIKAEKENADSFSEEIDKLVKPKKQKK
jgi:hypothetical protein